MLNKLQKVSNKYSCLIIINTVGLPGSTACMDTVRWCDFHNQADLGNEFFIFIPYNGAGLLNCTTSYNQTTFERIHFVDGRDGQYLSSNRYPGLLDDQTLDSNTAGCFRSDWVSVPWRPENERIVDLIIQCQVVYKSWPDICWTKNVKLIYGGRIHY